MTDRLARLVRDMEQQGVQFHLVEDRIEVTGLESEPWLNEWLDRNGRALRRLLNGEPPESLEDTDPLL